MVSLVSYNSNIFNYLSKIGLFEAFLVINHQFTGSFDDKTIDFFSSYLKNLLRNGAKVRSVTPLPFSLLYVSDTIP